MINQTLAAATDNLMANQRPLLFLDTFSRAPTRTTMGLRSPDSHTPICGSILRP